MRASHKSAARRTRRRNIGVMAASQSSLVGRRLTSMKATRAGFYGDEIDLTDRRFETPGQNAVPGDDKERCHDRLGVEPATMAAATLLKPAVRRRRL